MNWGASESRNRFDREHQSKEGGSGRPKNGKCAHRFLRVSCSNTKRNCRKNFFGLYFLFGIESTTKKKCTFSEPIPRVCRVHKFTSARRRLTGSQAVVHANQGRGAIRKARCILGDIEQTPFLTSAWDFDIFTVWIVSINPDKVNERADRAHRSEEKESLCAPKRGFSRARIVSINTDSFRVRELDKLF